MTTYEHSTPAHDATAVGARPSRYRSQRRTTHSSDEIPLDVPVPSLPEDAEIVRSKSRYHRKTSGSSPPATATSGVNSTGAAGHGQQDQPPTHAQSEVPSRYHSKSGHHSSRDHGHNAGSAQPTQHSSPRSQTPTSPNAGDARMLSPGSKHSSRPGLPRINSGAELDSGVELRDSPPPLPPPPALPAAHRPRASSTRRVPDHAPGNSVSIIPGVISAPPTGELYPPIKPPSMPPPGHGPPRSDQIRATKSMSEMAPQMVKSSRSGSGAGLGTTCLSMFKRRRADEDVPPVPKVDKAKISRPTTAKAEPAQSPQRGPPVGIMAGGGGAVPGTDAPVSAVNAGDRRVLIECGRFRNIFPVTLTTTPIDLIKSAANCMSDPIDLKSAVLLESFGRVGVERPLRRYEHVRDVMNSWDDDRQNSLLLVDPQTGTAEVELSLSGVPSAKPEEASWPMYLSQKPGKWERRYITLKTDGQVTSQKDAEKAKDLTNICHLSDFDIYTPTADKARRKIKPPKKYCYAIKSQQKTAMFEETSDFVHFFCTADKAVADSFYRAMQSWRSWYLVNVLGEGRKTAAAPPVAEPKVRSPHKHTPTVEHVVHGHQRNSSTASHYQLGTFGSLLDMSQFDRQPEKKEEIVPFQPLHLGLEALNISPAKPEPNVKAERSHASRSAKTRRPTEPTNQKAILRDDEPLANLSRKVSLDRRPPSFDQSRRESAEFRSNGLLGRQYSMRLKESTERAVNEPQPFTNGPSLLNGGADTRAPPLAGDGIRRQGSTRHTNADHPRRSSSTREPHGQSFDLARSGSTRARGPPQPLIDLTPKYREPPQHARKGRGFHPDNVGPGGLIDKATSLEDPLGVPASTDWQNRKRSNSNTARQHAAPPGSAALDGGYVQGAEPSRTASHGPSRTRTHRRPTLSNAARPEEPFTGEGLLATVTDQGWGEQTKGRGVMDGSHVSAGRPMIDLGLESTFVQGSMLNRVEREQGLQGPIIDREKRVERTEKTGEGF